MSLPCSWKSRDSVVAIGTSFGLRAPSRRPDRLWGPPSLLSAGVTRPGREGDQSPPTSAEVKQMRIYTSTPPYAFMA
jgi:hypothetical protein